MGAGESRGKLQRLLQGAEGLAAACRHLGVARLDPVQLLLDQENLLACRRRRGSDHEHLFLSLNLVCLSDMFKYKLKELKVLDQHLWSV